MQNRNDMIFLKLEKNNSKKTNMSMYVALFGIIIEQTKVGNSPVACRHLNNCIISPKIATWNCEFSQFN